MRKISKTRRKELEEDVEALHDKLEVAAQLWADFQDAVRTRFQDEVEPAFAELLSLHENLQEEFNNLEAEAQKYFNARSEKWQSSDKGREYEEWIYGALQPPLTECCPQVEEVVVPDVDYIPFDLNDFPWGPEDRCRASRKH